MNRYFYIISLVLFVLGCSEQAEYKTTQPAVQSVDGSYTYSDNYGVYSVVTISGSGTRYTWTSKICTTCDQLTGYGTVKGDKIYQQSQIGDIQIGYVRNGVVEISFGGSNLVTHRK